MDLQKRIEESHSAISGTQKSIEAYGNIASNSHSILKWLSDIVSGYVYTELPNNESDSELSQRNFIAA